MTGPAQVAINDKAIRAQADRLAATGWDGDAYRFVESLLLNAVADGWKRLEPPPPLAGPGASRAAINAAIEAAALAVREAKDRRKKPAES